VVQIGGARAYVDRAVGCVFGELLKNEPLMKGNSDLDQLHQIFKLLGAPNEKIWFLLSWLQKLTLVVTRPGFSTLRNSKLASQGP
jgi:hypothetical protein